VQEVTAGKRLWPLPHCLDNASSSPMNDKPTDLIEVTIVTNRPQSPCEKMFA